MTRADMTLGASPRSLDGVLAGVTRLYRLYDMDDEQEQSVGPLHPDRVRSRLLYQLIVWLQPGVEEERRFYDLVDRELDLHKERPRFSPDQPR